MPVYKGALTKIEVANVHNLFPRYIGVYKEFSNQKHTDAYNAHAWAGSTM